MRAAASTLWARARNWQSQRVTRRSFTLPGVETVFQPVPSHNWQISAGALITSFLMRRRITYPDAFRPGASGRSAAADSHVRGYEISFSFDFALEPTLRASRNP